MAVNQVPPELLEKIFVLQIQPTEDTGVTSRHTSRRREMRSSALVCKSWLGPATGVLYRSILFTSASQEKVLESLTVFGPLVRQVFCCETNGGHIIDNNSVPDHWLAMTLSALAKCPNVLSASLDFLRGYGDVQVASTLQALETLSGFKKLDLQMPSGGLNIGHIHQVVEALPRLITLRCSVVGPRSTAYLPVQGNSLQEADITAQYLSDDDMLNLMLSLRGVQDLHVTFWDSRGTQSGVARALAAVSDSLQKLMFSFLSDGPLEIRTADDTRFPLQQALPSFTGLQSLMMPTAEESFFDRCLFTLLPPTVKYVAVRMDTLASTDVVAWISAGTPRGRATIFHLEVDNRAWGDDAALRKVCKIKGCHYRTPRDVEGHSDIQLICA